ncbi:uncharacterized protein LOC124454353 isoform X2 [Xenia sp. Carnegie-2017]|uniref:uncharacterized protein LOC124454353 isoform X2 n=1 Tax=Xenia sp. Carnegie-2017 TaxID=2897299 RepID=UPI001F039DB0|nr:uncharacterized protein LOC124454353 isoform X2 [Xenia sp. Carnegie-2017]
MSCAKVISRNIPEHYDSDCLYEGEFLQLDKELQYIRHAKLLVTRDRLLLEHLDHEESDSRSKNRLELSRSSVNINFLKNSPYTFTLNVKNSGNANNVYQLCDRPESWADFLKSIDLQEIINDDNGRRHRVLPQVTFDDDLDDTYTDSESECSSFSDDSSADDIGLPRCLTSLYAGQGLGAMSMLNVNNAMMMMNPGHVRRLNKRSGLFRGSFDILSQPGSETDDFLSHANSYPQIACNAKPERWNSLPILSELDNILLDDDLQFERFNRHKRDRFGTKHHVRREGTETANYHSSAVYRTEYGIKHATSPKELLLNEEIRKLITQPSDIKFCNTAGRRKDSSELEPISEAIIHENFIEPTKVCPTEQSKPRTYEIIDTTGGKFKLNLKRLWKRREKTNISKSGGKTYSSNQQERESNHVMFINKVAFDTQGTVPATPSFAVSNDRRGGLGHDVSGKKENVVVSSVSKQRESSTNSGKNTIGKKIVKKFLSPMSTLRSVSEEEKNLDLPQVTGLGYKSGNTNDMPVEDRRKKLLDTNPLHIAQELTLIDKELLVRIPWNELSTCGWMTKHKYTRSPSVMEMVEFFNRIALLIASEILFEVDPLMRVRVISKVVQVAEKLHALGNFNSLKALLGGLQCTPIYRLKETWRQVSSKRKKSFRGLTKLMSEDDNFAAYRKEVDNLMNQKTPCLPFLGDFLTQIAQTQTYLACRKKSPEPPKEEILEENIPNPSTPTPKSSRKKTRSRTSLAKGKRFF